MGSVADWAGVIVALLGIVAVLQVAIITAAFGSYNRVAELKNMLIAMQSDVRHLSDRDTTHEKNWASHDERIRRLEEANAAHGGRNGYQKT